MEFFFFLLRMIGFDDGFDKPVSDYIIFIEFYICNAVNML